MSNVILTEKQELFVQGIMNGETQSDAYRNSYETQTMSDKSVWVQSSKLRRNPKVGIRIKEIEAEQKEVRLYTMYEAVNNMMWLMETSRKDILVNGVRQANSGAFLKAANELHKLQILYPEDQPKDNGKNKSEEETVIIVSNADEMRKFVEGK